MLIIAQRCQLLLCGQVQYNFNELIQTFILNKIKCYSLPNVTHDCFVLPVITHYCLQLPMLWGPIPLNQIKSNDSISNWIELNWIERNVENENARASIFPSFTQNCSVLSLIVLCYSPQPCLSIFFVIWKSIQCNLIEMVYRWNCMKLHETLNFHLSHCYLWLPRDAHSCSVLPAFTLWTSSI